MEKKERVNYIKNSTVEELKRYIEYIPTPELTIEFLQRLGKLLKSGSSRHVFNIAPDKVLKVAFNEAGLLQNESELELWEDLQPYVPKVYDYHPDAYWIEMEKVSGDIKKMPEVVQLIETIDDFFEAEDLKELQDILENFDDFLNKTYEFEEEVLKVMSDYKSEKLKMSGKSTLSPNEMKNIKLDAYELVSQNIKFSPGETTLRDLILPIATSNDISVDKLSYLVNMVLKSKEAGIGDIHSDNLAVASDGRVLLIDFGFDDSKVRPMYQQGSSDAFDSYKYFDRTKKSNAAAFHSRYKGVNRPVFTLVAKADSSPRAEKDNLNKIKEAKNLIKEIILQEIWGEKESNIFKRLRRLDRRGSQFINYENLLSSLKRVGSGSSRIVYAVDDDLVIKLQKPGQDSQNEYEANPQLQSLFGSFAPRVFDVGKDYLWIVSERVTPVSNKRQEKEWMEKVGLGGAAKYGLSMYDLSSFLSDFHTEFDTVEKMYGKEALYGLDVEEAFTEAKIIARETSINPYADWSFSFSDFKKWAENPVIGLISRARKDMNVAIGDIGLGNIGFGADGRPVILDIGLSQSHFGDSSFSFS